MGPVDALWHVLNFLAPALGLGVLAASMTKLLWRSELRAVAWRHLALAACAGATAVQIGALLVFGREGRMLTYAFMVLACAVGLYWSGFVRRR